MGRAKLAMEYMKNERARNTTFQKRKKSLKKKAQELATLCDVPVCVVIYQGPDSDPDTFPENRDHVRSVVDRYVAVPTEESSKRSLNLRSVLGTNKAADEQQLRNHPDWLPPLDGFSKEELLELASVLEGKLQAAEEWIQGLRATKSGDILPLQTGGESGLGFAPMGLGGDAGSSSASAVVGEGSCPYYYYYDPNYLVDYGQVGPLGGGSIPELCQPAVYGQTIRFEDPHQMGGLNEQASFLY